MALDPIPKQHARRRGADAWCAEHADRIRDVAGRLVDTVGAWEPHDPRAITPSGVPDFPFWVLGSLLEHGGAVTAMREPLEQLRSFLAPRGRPARQPTGSHAASAATARDDLAVLCDEVAAAGDAAAARWTVANAGQGGTS